MHTATSHPSTYVLPQENPSVKEARAVLTEARQALTQAKDKYSQLQRQQQSDDEVLCWEAARDMLGVYQALLACEIEQKKAERGYREVFERAQASSRADFLQRLRKAHAELIPAIELAFEKNNAVLEVHAAAEGQGIKLPQVHIPQLTPDFLDHWRPTSCRELEG